MPVVDLTRLQQAVEARRPLFLSDLQALVDLDCGSHDKAGVDEAGRLVEKRLRADGWAIERLPDDTWGDTLVATLDGGGTSHVVLMGHLDTVFDTGTAAERPFRVEETTAYGPGVTDCKAGVLAGVNAVAALKATGTPFGRITYLLTPDEEVGSPSSKNHIRAYASGADAAFCLECARENGDIVMARKGCVDLVVDITGRAAHAGVEPEKGVNAALDAAKTTIALQELNGRWPGVTVNVGVIHAGSRPNIVCPSARLEVDVRAVELATFQTALEEVERVACEVHVEGVTKTLMRTGTHPPMEPTDKSDALVAKALDLAAQLGIETKACRTGGAADANTTSAMGVPTIDGLGPVGGNDHSPAEFLDLTSITPRVTLLAALIGTLA